jgi:hypothetical protein
MIIIIGPNNNNKSIHERSAENDNHIEETQNGPALIEPNIGITSETGNKYNNGI